MATRKQQKEELRARREQLERERAAAASQRTRLIRLGIAGLVAIAVVVVVVIVASGGSSKNKGLQNGAQGRSIARQVDRFLGGIPQQGSVLGRSGAPVTVTYFGDLQCPVCRDLTLGAFQQLVDGPVRAGKVKVQYRNMQTATHDMNEFQRQQTAALGAGDQQKLWNFVELFYHQQGSEGTGYATQDFVDGIARQIKGLDFQKWQQDSKKPAFVQQLHTDASLARAIGANSTPTLVIRGPHGAQGLVGDVPYSDVQTAIQKVS